ncbi:MAG: ABC transporter ATP-binding protein [Candidatus Thorarchaeota archaeon]|nr:MAG: ABC transporter ATP-binding protein [Candidatus Thorarchaeota archaeon]RLI58354.1 MAG: ABC transporter ATP-binding protein [Candidatus Thorarchaeota archaeon]
MTDTVWVHHSELGMRENNCMSAVEVRDLVKSFGDLIAVNDVSFEVREGEIFGLLGPNGAGKTTTLKMLMGLLDPDSGTSTIFGTSSQENPLEVKRNVGYVPEEQQLYDSLTPKELFDFIASIRQLPPETTQKRLRDMVKALDFEKYYNKLIVTLSQGNRQKTMLIAAMLHAPKLLILDEPFSGLDVRTTKIMKDIITIHAQSGGAVLLSTHVMEVAQGLCQRVAIIDDGNLIAQGTLDELRNQAKTEGATLEKVFLTLTQQEEEVQEGVDALRGALSS